MSSAQSPRPPGQLRVALVGGGIGGLSLAIALHSQSVECHIYEAALQFSEIGADVGLAPNARRAMDLIDARIIAAYNRHATLNASPTHREYFFQFRVGMDGRAGTSTQGISSGDLVAQPDGPDCGMNMIHRARFLEELVALIPAGSATFGKRLHRLKQTPFCVRLIFTDGTESEADVAIGCDGVKSVVRAELFGPVLAPRFSGRYAYRGLVSMDAAAALVGDEHARNSQAYVGYGGHVLTMAVDRGRTMNVVAFHTKADGAWADERWVLPLRQEDMTRDFGEWCSEVRGILGLLQQPDMWALFDHPPLQTLSVGHVGVMGDAAHATTPHQGSGAAMAIEDAYVLGKLVGAVKGREELSAAFAAYDAVRLERTMKVVATSRTCGEAYEFEDAIIGDDTGKLEEDLSQRYRWIWDADVE